MSDIWILATLQGLVYNHFTVKYASCFLDCQPLWLPFVSLARYVYRVQRLQAVYKN